ncbi:MAG TPA: AmmeMemoRadiSam system protein A [Planctomycetota bacterium]|nr:AmmeMemoRadiSam system protein A [Planctomycetota bacterium]
MNRYSPENRRILLDVALNSIRQGYQTRRPLEVDLQSLPAELQQMGNAFVTLEVNGNFQGCIGSLRAVAPLAQDVARNAFSAAYNDRRGRILTPADFGALHVHISVLSVPEPIQFMSEEDLVAQVRPGIDGLIVQENGASGTLLPSVWEKFPDAQGFVNYVKMKAGLPGSYWSSSIRWLRYTTESFSNHDQ